VAVSRSHQTRRDETLITVVLTQEEIAMCHALGNLRTFTDRVVGVQDRQVGKNEPNEIDEDGVLAEFAFCKHWNIFFNPVPHPRKWSYDCMLKGRRIDIKSTRYKDCHLFGPKRRNEEIDIYVLAIIDGSSVHFPGYAFADDLYNDARIKTVGGRTSHAIHVSELTKWKAKQ